MAKRVLSPFSAARKAAKNRRAVKATARAARRGSAATVAKTLTKDERAKRDAERSEKDQARRDSPRTVAKTLTKDERAKRDAERSEKDQARRDSPRTVAKVLTKDERAAKDQEREEAKSAKAPAPKAEAKGAASLPPISAPPKVLDSAQVSAANAMQAKVRAAAAALRRAA